MKTGDRGFYDAGRVQDMSPKQKAKFFKSYDKYTAEYRERASKGAMFQKMLTPNQYLNEYSALRNQYISAGKDPGKRHLPEQIARNQQYERDYRGDLKFYRGLKGMGAFEGKFKEFRQMQLDDFSDEMKIGKDKMLHQIYVKYQKMGWSSATIGAYVSKYYYGSE